MNFLNSGAGYALFYREAIKKYYVDKSLLIDKVFQYALETNAYICITRPRRFGKSVAANMIAAFFDESTGEESAMLFDGLLIGSLKEGQLQDKGQRKALCWREQGRLKVIRINMMIFRYMQTRFGERNRNLRKGYL